PPHKATRTDPERTHLREARLPWALNGAPYVWWLFAVRRYIPNTSLRAERGYSRRSPRTGVHRGDGRSENNKILLKTVQLSTSTVWGRGHRRPSEITANSGPSASRYRRGGVYAHKAASTTTWNHRTSRRTKTSRLTPEVDRKEETWAVCARLPREHVGDAGSSINFRRPGPPVDQENTGTVGGDFQWRLVFDAMYHKIVTPQQDLAISAITPQEHLATRQGSMVTRTGSQWMGALRLVRNRCIFTSAVLVALRFPGETHKTPRYVSPPLSCNAFTHRTFQQDGVVIAARTSKSISPEFQAGDLEAPGWLLGRYQGRGIKVDLWWPLASSCPSPHLEIVWVTEALRAYSLGFMLPVVVSGRASATQMRASLKDSSTAPQIHISPPHIAKPPRLLSKKPKHPFNRKRPPPYVPT
ncbi:hypothetical protein FA13DRAFT_1720145, partial [Coprinellus micaceus]